MRIQAYKDFLIRQIYGKSAIEEDRMTEKAKVIKMVRNMKKKEGKGRKKERKKERRKERKKIHLNGSSTRLYQHIVYQKLKSFNLCSKKWSVEEVALKRIDVRQGVCHTSSLVCQISSKSRL
jgi:hypothetical protein